MPRIGALFGSSTSGNWKSISSSRDNGNSGRKIRRGAGDYLKEKQCRTGGGRGDQKAAAKGGKRGNTKGNRRHNHSTNNKSKYRAGK